jgi:membrane-bound lytic murein transglycosylase D
MRYLEQSMTTGMAPDQLDPAYILLGSQSPPIIWKILARKMVIELEEPTYHPPVNYLLYPYANGEGQTLNTLARRLRITEERIKPFNQWLRTGEIPSDKDYTVLIQMTPDEVLMASAFAEPKAESRNSYQLANGFPVVRKTKVETDKLRSSAVYYTINERRGIQAQDCDNAITLAFYGGIRLANFFKYNDLDEERDVIRPGEIYYLERKARRAKIPFHITQKNQTLREISNMYGVLLASLLTFNRMEAPQRLQTGQVLWLQTKRPANQPVRYIQMPAKGMASDVPDKSDTVVGDSGTIAQNVLPSQIAEKGTEPTDLRTTDSLVILNDSLDTMHEAFAGQEKDRLTLSIKTVEKTTLHTVTKGQTYYAVARLYGITVKQLYNWNNLSEADVLTVGQKLIVRKGKHEQITGVHSADRRQTGPVKSNSVSEPVRLMRNAVFYTVRAGQTLYNIAVLNKVQVKDLIRWNNLSNYVIKVGQILVLWK